MTVKSYQDLEIWQKAMDLAEESYRITKDFPKSETYGLCSQLQRAAVSIPANIAEGRGRQHTKEFLQHLYIVYGSLAELETCLMLAKRLAYIQSDRLGLIMSKAAELGRMINGLQRSLKSRDQGINLRSPIPDPRPLNSKGFSLVELLVAMAIASVLGMAGVALFSTSNWTYKVNEDVSEAQQNVRVAMEWLSKDIRTAGFGLEDEPQPLWFDVDGDGSQDSGETFTSPITVTNSSTDPDTITILGIGYEAGVLENDATDDGEDDTACNGTGDNSICLCKDSSICPNDYNEPDNFFSDTTYKSVRRYITLNGTTFIELSSTATDHTQSTGKMRLSTTLDRDYPDGTPVYIIQAVTYSIGDTGVGCSDLNPCLKSNDLTELRGAGNQTVAESIEDLQFAYGIDVSPRDGKIDDYNEDGSFTTADFVDDPADDLSIIGIRASVVAKTRNIDMKGGQFRRQCVEDRSTDTTCTNAAKDGYRRRLLTKIIKLRNPRAGGT